MGNNDEYDIFLSFRGTDTRRTFTGYLYDALYRKGLNIFIDDEALNGGDQISQSLINAIQQSRMSIVVLSENYASSTWCLDELVEILECRRSRNHIVWPIFYGVEPSHVRHQTYTYAQAMAKHEARFGDGSDKVQKWRSALSQIAGLSGSQYETSRYEYDFIDEIVEKVSSRLPRKQLEVGELIIGHQSRIEEVKALLEIESNQTVCMLGIHGTGGMGKTTLAKGLYNSIVKQFESAVFLENVREISSSSKGLLSLQKTILSKLSKEKKIKLGSDSEGVTRLKAKFQRNRVLLVLDDVDSKEQLEKLAGKWSWFKSGSRIIITTRDKHVLDGYDVKIRYEMKGLNRDEALELFSWNAFKTSKPAATAYEKVSKRVVDYADGLPLALRVIGSNMAGRTVEECEAALNQYERIPEKNIQAILKKSYDSLEDNARNIFLDIACFFNGKKLQHVKEVWDKCDFSPSYNISVLDSKCLVAVIDGRLWMHDLIRDMGKEIVRQEAPLRPGKRSRLYSYQDVLQVLRDNSGSYKIQGIVLDPPEKEEVNWNGMAFEKMNNLRILIIRKTHFTQAPNYLPNSLRLLKWEGYPSTYLSLVFHLDNIVDLSLPFSHLSLEKSMLLPKVEYLTHINFSWCDNLTHFPDVSGVPNLSQLDLRFCKNLREIDHSVWFLQKLKLLLAIDCSKLQEISPRMSLPALQRLDLYGTSIASFPQIEEDDDDPLQASSSSNKCPPLLIKKKLLPDSMTELEYIKLGSERGRGGCPSLGGLPSGLFTLPKLKYLALYNYVVEFIIEPLKRLLINSHVMATPAGPFTALRDLICCHCGLTDEHLHIILCCFPNLEQLSVNGNEFVSLPESIKGCSNLTFLDVRECMKLQEIPELPTSIQSVYADGCPSLSSEAFNTLWSLALKETYKLTVEMPGSEIPDWFDHRCRGRTLSFWARGKFPILAVAFIMNKDAACDDVTLWVNGDRCKVRYHALFISPENAYIFDLRSLLDDHEWPIIDTYLVDGGWNHVEVKFEGYGYEDDDYIAPSSCGAYVYRQETNMEDIRFTCPNPLKRTLSIVDDDHQNRKLKPNNIYREQGITD